MRRRAVLRGALRPPTRASGGGGERPNIAVSSWTPGDPLAPSSRLSSSSCEQSPPRAHSPAWRAQDLISFLRSAGNSWIERWPVTPVAPPGTGSVAEPGVEAQVCRRMRDAWHRPRPPLPAGCRGGARRGGQVSRGPRSGVMGCQRPRAHGEGPSALIRQGRALAPDSCLPEPGPGGQAPGNGVLWGTEPAWGGLQPSPGRDRA